MCGLVGLNTFPGVRFPWTGTARAGQGAPRSGRYREVPDVCFTVPPLRHLALAGPRPAASARGAVLPDVGVVAGRRARALPPARRALGPHVRHRRRLVRRGVAGHRGRPAPTRRPLLAAAGAAARARPFGRVLFRGEVAHAEARTMFGATRLVEEPESGSSTTAGTSRRSRARSLSDPRGRIVERRDRSRVGRSRCRRPPRVHRVHPARRVPRVEVAADRAGPPRGRRGRADQRHGPLRLPADGTRADPAPARWRDARIATASWTTT